MLVQNYVAIKREHGNSNRDLCTINLQHVDLDSVSCFSNDSSVSSFSEAIEKFLSGISGVRSIDGYLIKLTSLIQMVLESYRGNTRVISYVLSCREVIKALEPLAYYIDEVTTLITKDPRHKPLRPYLSLIISTLTKILHTTTSKKELEIVRPSIWRLGLGLNKSRIHRHDVSMVHYTTCDNLWYKSWRDVPMEVDEKFTRLFKERRIIKNGYRVERSITKSIVMVTVVSIILSFILLLLLS